MAIPAMASSAVVRKPRKTGWLALLAYILLYAATLSGMSRWGHFDPSDALGVAVILGGGFSLLAWLLTIRVTPLSYTVNQPARELSSLLLYLLPLMAFVTWGFDAVRRIFPADPVQAFAMLLAKLAIFVAVPAWIMRSRHGYRWRQVAPASFRTGHLLVAAGISFVLLLFQAIVGRGLRDLRSAHLPTGLLVLGVPIAFLWLALEAGIVEEFFFRCLLQSRLAARLRSEVGGIVIMALLFGLVHAPGLYLRTNLTQEDLAVHPSLFMAVGYSIVITSVAGFFLGVLWARTRNLAVVVIVHAAADLLPDLLPTLRSLHILR